MQNLIHQNRLAISKLCLVLLSIYFISKPFYFFPSGYPQLADSTIPILLILTLLSSNQRPKKIIPPVLKAALLFTIYASSINFLWATIELDLEMALSGIYYIFNLCIFYIIFDLAQRAKSAAYKLIKISLFFSVLLQVIFSFYSTVAYSPSREFLGFNNPNQLGYFSLLACSIYYYCMQYDRGSIMITSSYTIMIIYLAALSLSKAAIISLGLLFIIQIFKNPKLIVFIALLLLPLTFSQFGENLTERVQSRVDNIGQQKDDSIEGRGYNRIWKYPQHLAFGAGEFGFSRFERMGSELHSTFGTIIFSYGIVGSFLFLNYIWRIYRARGTESLLYLLPPFLYGLTHQGLRFSMLWVLFALVSSANNKKPPSLQPI